MNLLYNCISKICVLTVLVFPLQELKSQVTDYLDGYPSLGYESEQFDQYDQNMFTFYYSGDPSEDQIRFRGSFGDPYSSLTYGHNPAYFSRLFHHLNIGDYRNYLFLEHTEGKGIGYNKGYTTVGLFFAPSYFSNSYFQAFLDDQLYIFNDGKKGASLGGGIRFFIPGQNIVVGLNTYFDYRRKHSQDFNQLGVGFEFLTPCWDFRVNGYFSLGSNDHRRFCFFDWSNDFFAIRQGRTSAWHGADAEFGTWLKVRHQCYTCRVYLAGGPYYYFREHKSNKFFEDNKRDEAFGGRVRVFAQVGLFGFGASVTYDPVWHTRAQGQISFTIPFGGCNSCEEKSCCIPCNCQQICLQPVQRNGIIPVDQDCCWVWNWSEECSCSGSSSSSPTSLNRSSFNSFYSSDRCSGGYCR